MSTELEEKMLQLLKAKKMHEEYENIIRGMAGEMKASMSDLEAKYFTKQLDLKEVLQKKDKEIEQVRVQLMTQREAKFPV